MAGGVGGVGEGCSGIVSPGEKGFRDEFGPIGFRETLWLGSGFSSNGVGEVDRGVVVVEL